MGNNNFVSCTFTFVESFIVCPALPFVPHEPSNTTTHTIAPKDCFILLILQPVQKFLSAYPHHTAQHTFATLPSPFLPSCTPGTLPSTLLCGKLWITPRR